MDERLVAYVREQWGELVRLAMLLCPDADEAAAQRIVMSALTRCGRRWRLRAEDADLDVEVRRALLRACVERGKRRQGRGEDFATMEVTFVDQPTQRSIGTEAGSGDLVRQALAELPPRHRAALVLRYGGGAEDPRAAELLGCSAEALAELVSTGLDELGEILVVDAAQVAGRDGSTQTEGLVRAAFANAPGPRGLTPVPVESLSRRIVTARRRRVLGASVAVAVVLAVGLSAMRSGGHPTPAAPRAAVATGPVAFPKEPADFVSGVTAGGGAIWTIESHPIRHSAITYVVRRNPISGFVEGRYPVPEPDNRIGYGLGRAWVWHDNTDFPTTAIATVDARGDVATLRSTPSIAIEDATFAAGDAWFTEPKANSVLTMRDGRLGAVATIRVSGARFVVPLSVSSVLVAGSSGELRELPGNRVIEASQGPVTLLAPAPSYGFWVGRGNQLSYVAGAGVRPSLTVTMPSRVAAVTGDPAHGVFVALQSPNPQRNTPYLLYYSPAALAAVSPQPTGQVDGRTQIEDMIANPVGGVVFVTNFGVVKQWQPPQTPPQVAPPFGPAPVAGAPSVPTMLR